MNVIGPEREPLDWMPIQREHGVSALNIGRDWNIQAKREAANYRSCRIDDRARDPGNGAILDPFRQAEKRLVRRDQVIDFG